jgi:hypothetical protein
MLTDESDEKRNIILLGHDTLSDIRYLQQLGYDPVKEENILEVMDTAVMYRVWHRDQQPTKLGKILNDFDIIGWKLHNAGNDAVYTLQAMLGICVREATIREWEKAAEIPVAREEVDQGTRGDVAGWSEQQANSTDHTPEPMPAQSTPTAVPQYDGSSDNDACIGQAWNHGQTEDVGFLEMTHGQEQGHWQDLLDLSANITDSESIPNVSPQLGHSSTGPLFIFGELLTTLQVQYYW